MLHALLATIGTLAILVSIVVKLIVRPAEAEEERVPVVTGARGDRPCHRVRGRVRGRGRSYPARVS